MAAMPVYRQDKSSYRELKSEYCKMHLYGAVPSTSWRPKLPMVPKYIIYVTTAFIRMKVEDNDQRDCRN